MVFYVVEGGELIKRRMCDNRRCMHYSTRGEGMPMDIAIVGFQVCSMAKFDACSPACRNAIADI